MAQSEFDFSPWFIIRTKRMAHREYPTDRPASMDIWLGGIRRVGWETYYPLIRDLRIAPRRKLSRMQRTAGAVIMLPHIAPLLPGYVFVRGGQIAKLVRGPCVIEYVATTGGAPARISNALIARLRTREVAEDGGAIPGTTPAGFIFYWGCSPRVSLSDVPVQARLKLTLGAFEGAAPLTETAL